VQNNDKNLKKALLVGVLHISKSGYLSEINNLKVYPMHGKKFFNYFGFTEDEVSILLQYYDKVNQLEGVNQWYNGYRAGNNILLYNPWSINSFIDDGTLEAHWINTGKYRINQLLLELFYNIVFLKYNRRYSSNQGFALELN
jgi:hypothetical protein